MSAPKIIQMPLPNYYRGWPKSAEIAIVHYSAGYSVASCHQALLSRELSAHESVERDGVIYQHLDHGNRGIHAGHGQWGGRGNINSRALGVEVINFGWGYEGDGSPSDYNKFGPADDELEQDLGGVWHRVEKYTKNGKTINTRILTKQKMEKYPDHRAWYSDKLWSAYTKQQVESTHWLIWSWMQEHPEIILENVIGHEHVSPHRKADPGPAWPWRETEQYLECMAVKERPELLDPSVKSREKIKAVQSHVHRCGENIGSIDGLWGPKTKGGVVNVIKKYDSVYKLNLTADDINPESCLKLANAFRLIPGFNYF